MIGGRRETPGGEERGPVRNSRHISLDRKHKIQNTQRIRRETPGGGGICEKFETHQSEQKIQNTGEYR